MANGPKCSICGKPATVHFTQIIDGKAQKMDFCEECANKKGLGAAGFEAFSELLAEAGAPVDPEMNKKMMAALAMAGTELETGESCEVCGFKMENFKKTARLGCPHCYRTFEAVLEPMLKEMHMLKGEVLHKGKVPAKSLSRRSLNESLADLERSLKEAIKKEQYEEAAVLRDQMRELKEMAEKTQKEEES